MIDCKVSSILLIALLGLGIFAILERGTTVSGQATSTLTVGIVSSGPIVALNPLFPGGQSAIVISQLTGMIYQSMLLQAPNGTIKPQLAESWSVSPDATVFTFNLRPNLKWSDGSTLDSNDVVYTFNLLKSSSLLDAFNGFIVGPLIKTVTAVNSTAVRFTLTHSFSPFLNYAGLGKVIVPEHVYSKIANITSFTNAGSPVGDGPYVLVNWTPSSSVLRFSPNPNYYGTKPKLDNVVIQILSPTANIPALLQTGELDLAQPSPTQVAALKGSANVTVVTSPGISIFGTYFDPAGLLMFDDALYPYSMAAVRQAIAYAVNRAQIVSLALNGYGVAGNQGQLPPSMTEWIPSSLPDYAFDTAKAKALLTSAGFKMGSNGFFNLPNGSAWKPIVMDAGGVASSIGSVVVQNLRAAGIDASESAVTLATVVQGLNFGTFDIIVLQTSRPPIPDFVLGVFASNVTAPIGRQVQDYHGWTRWVNLTSWNDLQQARNVGGFSDQYRLYSAAQTILATEVPLIVLYYGQSIWAYSNIKVQGWAPATQGYQFPQAPLMTSLFVPAPVTQVSQSSTVPPTQVGQGNTMLYMGVVVAIILIGIVAVAYKMRKR